MGYDVFAHRGGNFERIAHIKGIGSKRAALTTAAAHHLSTGEASLVFTDHEVGRLVEQFGRYPGQVAEARLCLWRIRNGLYTVVMKDRAYAYCTERCGLGPYQYDPDNLICLCGGTLADCCPHSAEQHLGGACETCIGLVTQGNEIAGA